MPDSTIPECTLRTTSDGSGHVHGLALGSGLTLDEALTGLAARAQAQAEELAAEYRGDEHRDRPDAEWRFEVADVRIVAGPPHSDRESWVAYGTLRSIGVHPWAASYWQEAGQA
jgi:hypothetical protein